MSAGEADALEFRVLGTFEVVSQGRLVPIGSPKQRALLAMLALDLNRVVSLDAIVDELWGKRPLTSPNSSVQSLVSRLRHSLSGASPGPGAALVGREPGYVLEADRGQVDGFRFEYLTGRGRKALERGDAQAAVDALEQALGLWRGPALADLANRRFAQVEAVRLEEARLGAVEELVEAELALGRPERVLARLEGHVAANPLRERPWGQLMVALYRLGRQADALRAYQEVRRLLRDELGLEPTPWLRGLEDQILHQRPELDGRPQAVPGLVAGSQDDAWRGAGDTVVVFLFTDIEASTRRWEGDHDAMSEDLARHDAVLRKAVEEGLGRVFAHTGDGLCAAFPTSQAAVAAAVAGQRRLRDEKWVAAAPLRVRMAIHAGAAELREGNYVGPTLNRTARLLSLSHGGQILCSHVAADLLRDQLPADLSLVPLGEQPLADLSRPECVFQVRHPDLPATFPPLRSPGGRRHNLPGSLTSFVGRTRELDEVRGLLRSSRLVTLTGVGGVGKTRLALQVAGGLLDDFPDGVWLVELGPVSDPALVAPTVMAALGLTSGAPPAGSPADRLFEYLEERRALVVFDNCEHLVDGTAELVRALLCRCPTVTVATTSRELLGLPGEVAWRVPPLSVPADHGADVADLTGSDAVTLFCQRARTAQPGFDLSAANAAAVGQICRRLDGIPLALELAAARIRVLGAHQIAERLNDRFRLLKGGARSSVPRHQTLRAAVDWSHDLLPIPEQTALRRLSVFPGSFDLEAAQAVVGDDVAPSKAGFDVLDLLSRLVDKSLVGVESGSVDVRYRLLETVREYAAEKLAEAGETDSAYHRHRDFYLALATRHPAGEFWNHTTAAIGAAGANHDSFRSALEWSLDRCHHDAVLHLVTFLWPYWVRARPGEGVDWFARAVDPADNDVTPARLDALIGRARLLQQSGKLDLVQVERLMEDARGRALTAGFRRLTHLAEYYLGELATIRGDWQSAGDLLNHAIAGSDPESLPVVPAWSHHALGWLALARDDPRTAEFHFQRTAEIADTTEWDGRIRIHALASLAVVAAANGEPARAMSLADEAVAGARLLGYRPTLVMALVRAAEAADITGESVKHTLRELLGLLDDLGRSPWIADGVEIAVLVHEQEGRLVTAAQLSGAGRALRKASGGPTEGNASLGGRLRSARERLSRDLGTASLARHEKEGEAKAGSVRDVITLALGCLEEV